MVEKSIPNLLTQVTQKNFSIPAMPNFRYPRKFLNRFSSFTRSTCNVRPVLPVETRINQSSALP